MNTPSHTVNPGLHFEEVAVGQSWSTPNILVSEDDMVRFALEWDPHPFHIDREAAKASVFGDLCASGLQTLLLSYRAFTRLRLFEGTTLAGLGLDQLKFIAPFYAGDTLKVGIHVEDAIATRKPDRGLLKIRLVTYNQTGALLSECVLPMLVKRLVPVLGSETST